MGTANIKNFLFAKIKIKQLSFSNPNKFLNLHLLKNQEPNKLENNRLTMSYQVPEPKIFACTQSTALAEKIAQILWCRLRESYIFQIQ